MSYRLIKSQIGGGNCEILILIAAIVVVWFLFVQSNSPKKEKFDLTESYTPINAQVKSSSPSSTVSEQESIYDSPAVDLKAPGVPYLPPPRHFNPPDSSEGSKNKLKNNKDKNRVTRVTRRSFTPSETKSTETKSTKSNISISMSIRSDNSPKVGAIASSDSKVGSPPYLSPIESTPGYGSSEASQMSKGLSIASSPNSIPVMTVISESERKERSKSKKSNKIIEKFTDVNKLYSVRDSYDLKTPLSKATCSQKCCGYYWKENMDGMFKKDDPVKWGDVGVGKKYRSSNVTCMGDGVSAPGCRCHTTDQYELLATRGGNGSKNY